MLFGFSNCSFICLYILLDSWLVVICFTWKLQSGVISEILKKKKTKKEKEEWIGNMEIEIFMENKKEFGKFGNVLTE